MITLTGKQLIATCDVFPDDVDPLLWYVMPKGPRVALDDHGNPMFHLTWFRRPVDQLTEEERRTRLGGGILTLSTDLTPTADEEAEIRKTLAGQPAVQAAAGPGLAGDEDKVAAALKLGAVPVKDGTVSIAVLAENPQAGAPAGEFVANLVGVGRVSASGVGRSSFMAKLTQDGAALLWEMVEKNLEPIRVEYDLTFDHRLTGVTMVVHCDVAKAFDAVQEQWAHLRDDGSFSEVHDGGSSTYSYSRDENNSAGNVLHKIASNAEAISISIIPEAGPDSVTPELITQLTQQANDMVTNYLADTFLAIDNDFTPDEEPKLETELASYGDRKYGHHGIEYYKLKEVHTDVTGNLDYTLRTKAVVTGHLTPNDNMADVTGGRPVGGFRTQIDIDPAFYKFLAVEVMCTANFDAEPVDLVRGTLRYHSGDIDEAKTVVFSKADPAPKEFATYLSGPGQRTYDYDLEVFYRGSAQTLRRSGRSDENVLVLDTDALGIVRVDVQCGVVDWERIATVLVELSHGQGAARREAQLTLTSGHDHDTWLDVTSADLTQPYSYRLTFVDKQGQRIAVDPATSTAKTLVVEQPIGESLEVAVVPAGSFGADGLISKVVVALRYVDPGHDDYTVDDIVTLAGEADSKVWTVPLVDRTRRGYAYRTTVFYSDGVTREDDWVETDKTVLAVGDPFGMRVQILPYRLKLADRFDFGTIHLSFADPVKGITAEKDLQITDFSQPLYWRFRLGAPERHTYSYQLTLFTKDGQELAMPVTEASREVLTLAPPAA